jgi:hypothetical protein
MTAIWKYQTNVFIKYYDEAVDKPTNSTHGQTHLSMKHKVSGVIPILQYIQHTLFS